MHHSCASGSDRSRDVEWSEPLTSCDNREGRPLFMRTTRHCILKCTGILIDSDSEQSVVEVGTTTIQCCMHTQPSCLCFTDPYLTRAHFEAESVAGNNAGECAWVRDAPSDGERLINAASSSNAQASEIWYDLFIPFCSHLWSLQASR